MAGNGIKQGLRLTEKNTGVPVHLAGKEELLGFCGIGLFDETGGLAAAVGTNNTLFDIAIGGTGEAGRDAKGDDGAGQSRGQALRDGLEETLAVGNMVVGRAEQQNVVRIGL